jgi:flagellar basal-body rod protein FlgB
MLARPWQEQGWNMKIFDATLGRLERALDVRLARHNVLAGNLANVDTPGYKPRDVDFAAAMAAVPQDGVAGTTSTQRTEAGHMAATVGTGVGGAGGDVPITERAGEAPTLDGNRVDLDRTMAELATNGMQYGAGARVASKKLAILRYVVGDGQG